MCAIDFSSSSKDDDDHDARKPDFPKGMGFGAAWLLDCNGHLFLVDVSCVGVGFGVDPHNIGAVRVYMMDFSSAATPASSKPRRPRWRRVCDIGDAVFLLDDTCLAASCSASMHGLKRNQVYFMKNFVEDDADLCVFDLETECQEITRVHHRDGRLAPPPQTVLDRATKL